MGFPLGPMYNTLPKQQLHTEFPAHSHRKKDGPSPITRKRREKRSRTRERERNIHDLCRLSSSGQSAQTKQTRYGKWEAHLSNNGATLSILARNVLDKDAAYISQRGREYFTEIPDDYYRYLCGTVFCSCKSSHSKQTQHRHVSTTTSQYTRN